jgi:FixJ family two-component response regulator
VVDDEAPVRAALGRLLRLADYDLATFASGEEFLGSLAARRPDCIILDIHMPGLSGLDVQSRLSAAHLDIPVIFITAGDDSALNQSAMDAGAIRLLHKPFSGEDLLDAVGAALRR